MRSNNDKPSVRVTALRVHNVMGFADCEVKPGKVTLIKGSNGVGKTTLIESFKAVLKGGHDGTLLRNGEESGEIVMILSDGAEIKKRIRSDKSDTQVTHPDFGKLSKPAAYLNDLRDAFAVNPVDFLTANPERRVELLLSAIPMLVNPVDLAGIKELCKDAPDLSRHALQVLASIQKDLEDQRRDINRSAKEKRASMEELRKALPPATGADGKSVLTSVELEYSDFRSASEMAKGAIVNQANLRANAARDEQRKATAELDRRRDEEVEAIRSKCGKDADAIRILTSNACDSINETANRELEELVQHRAAKTQEFESALATARANADAYIRAQSAREHIVRMENSAIALEDDSETLTTGLADLDNVRGNLLENLPIKGVTLGDGYIFVDGIPFDRVNESRRIRLAIEVAMLRSGNLPFIVVDGAEALDSSNLSNLAEVAAEMGIQMVLSAVTDSPLEIEVLA